MAQDEEGEIFRYIPYVTLREGWAEIKTTFFAWLLISGFVVVLGAVFEFGAAKTEEFWSVLPKPAWYIIGFGAFTWLLRGEELRIAFPKSFKLWFCTTIAVAVIVLAVTVLPFWAMVPVYCGVVLGAASLGSLAHIGKANFLKLSNESGGEVVESEYDDED